MDKVLDRVIGPGPESLNHIMDDQTVSRIKATKNKVINENDMLRQKMQDMQMIMEKTTGENQRLRSHIQVLIGDNGPGSSPERTV